MAAYVWAVWNEDQGRVNAHVMDLLRSIVVNLGPKCTEYWTLAGWEFRRALKIEIPHLPLAIQSLGVSAHHYERLLWYRLQPLVYE